jgi:hypothetical protein
VTRDAALERSKLDLFNAVSLVTKLGKKSYHTKMKPKFCTERYVYSAPWMSVRTKIPHGLHMQAGSRNFAVDMVHKAREPGSSSSGHPHVGLTRYSVQYIVDTLAYYVRYVVDTFTYYVRYIVDTLVYYVQYIVDTIVSVKTHEAQ